MEFAQPGSSNPSLLKGILARRFRANPIFRLFRHTELAPEHQETFAGLAEDPDQFGVLVPASHAGLGVLAVDQDTARLFSGLKRPGPLPEACGAAGSIATTAGSPNSCWMESSRSSARVSS